MFSALLAGALVVTPGCSGSQNFGETRSLNPALRVGFISRTVEAFGEWDGANKMESGRGFIIGADILLRHRSLVGGGSYRYRDGGDWVKRSVWARAGIERGRYRLVYGHDLNSANQVRTVTLGIRHVFHGHWIVEPQLSAASYRQAGRREVGVVTMLWLGHAW
jgi:hypothetical protein